MTFLWQILVLLFDIVDFCSDVSPVDLNLSLRHCELPQQCLWWILVILFDIVNFYSDISLAGFANPNLSLRHCEVTSTVISLWWI